MHPVSAIMTKAAAEQLGHLACSVTSLVTLRPQQGTDCSPPGNSHIPEVQIKTGRFFLPVQEKSLTTCLKHNVLLLSIL